MSTTSSQSDTTAEAMRDKSTSLIEPGQLIPDLDM